MLSLSETVILFPKWTRSFLPFWKRFVQAWDDLYDVGTDTSTGLKGFRDRAGSILLNLFLDLLSRVLSNY